MILTFPSGGGSVFYGMAWAHIVAAEAHGASVTPLWCTVSQSDVVHGTALDAFAAGYAVVDSEFARRHAVSYKPGIYHTRFYPCKRAPVYIGDTFA